MLKLTDAQQQWLTQHQQRQIKYCFNANWAPYDSLKDGKPQGIFHDYLGIFTQRLGIEFVPHITPDWTAALAAVQRGDCAFLVGAVKTPEREAFLNFTSPYFSMYNVLVAKPDKPFIGSLDSLNGKSISGPRNGAVMQWLAKEHPGIKQVNVVTGDETLALVMEDKAYAAVSPLDSFVADYKWQIHNLKIIGKLDYPYPISVAVRKDQPELFSLMEVAVNSLGEADHAAITRKYQSFTVVEEVDYRKLAGIVAVALALIGYLYYSNRRLSGEIARRQRAEAELVHLAHHDALTGLPSLRMGMAQLDAALLRSQRTRKLVGVLFIDLDGFKAVNDNWGHQAGDALLKQAALAIQSSLRSSDMAARIGGDEFIVLLEDADKVEDMMVVGRKIQQALACTFSVGEASVQVTASIGLAVHPLHANDAESLMKMADQAMYEAKRAGKNTVQMANNIRQEQAG
ncbi:diguanylate cyclase [Vogesella sp. LYT5W]|uniref:Diguanylate cyclase n=1 Tax=Vogesella margarita TaxID=2984199 RepID=A0ABT5IJ36_9NEIS|nr:diguanylate cyclase [Vogesella margarita]MDC7712546.1 diguanylate cyclase [Vogesella margarita]